MGLRPKTREFGSPASRRLAAHRSGLAISLKDRTVIHTRTRLRTAICLASCWLLGIVCVAHSANETAPPHTRTEQIAKRSNTVEYQGVSFTFDQVLAREVKSETIPAAIEGKPSDIWPEHPAFTLVGYAPLRRAPPNFPQIRVFEIAKFREAMRHAGTEMGKSMVPPTKENWVPWVDDEIRVLRKLIAGKPKQRQVKTMIGRKHTGIGCYGIPQMPFLPMWESCQPFVAHVRYVNFKNGKGIFFLTQWMTETERVTNAGLEYAFQGITNDGRYWVYAEFSASAPFLPQGDEPEVIAWAEKNYLLSYKTRKFQNYLRPVVAKLEALPANKFQPNLELLEQLIASLEIKAK